MPNATSTTSGKIVRWTSTSDAVKYFDIYRRPDSVTASITTGDIVAKAAFGSNHYVDLVDNQSYWYWIKAISWAGKSSDFSNTITAEASTGSITIGGDLVVCGNTTLTGTLQVSGATTINNSLTVSGAATVSSLDVTANASVSGTLHVSGAVTFGGNLNVSGTTSFNDDVSFNTYKAIAMTCDNGATVPAAPVAGQWFLHTPTGRKVLMMYNGSNWISIVSLGTMIVYVDATDGSDAIDQGGAVDAGAFTTVQYAVDLIPGLVGGNVTINVNAESYAETVAVRGKSLTGNYSITIAGTLTISKTDNIDSAVQGTGATQGSITAIGDFGTYDNKLMYANNEYRIIDSDTANVATIVGTFTSVPSGTYTVYDWGTTITRIAIGEGQLGVFIQDLKTTDIVYVYSGAYLKSTRCWHYSTSYYAYEVRNYATGELNTCYISTTTSHGILVKGYYFVYRTKCYGAGNAKQGLIVTGGGYCLIGYASIIDDYDSTAGAIACKENSTISIYSGAVDGYLRVRNNGTYGFRASLGGQIINIWGLIQYSGNGTDESAHAASFGYIG